MDANTTNSLQIIPFYSHPHVFTVINNNSFYDETVAVPKDPNDLPFATAVVSGFDKGIDNKFVLCNDLQVKNELFGKANYKKYGQPSIQIDQLFNGYTNVWICRALPDNATYANLILMAHYRRGKVLNNLGQETGKYRMEIKFSFERACKPTVVNGARSEDDIIHYANSLAKTTADPRTGYMRVPIAMFRPVGRGDYGNDYAISISRDTDYENEYDMKMYMFSLISNESVTKIANKFTGTLTSGIKYNSSTLISDVMDQYTEGSCPLSIYPFEDNYEKLYNFYRNEVVMANYKYISESGSDPTEMDELNIAMGIEQHSFDPLFGIMLNSRTDEQIPYYCNYTARDNTKYVAPDLTIPNVAGATKPLNVSEWSGATVGAKVLVVADPINAGMRWTYTVLSIDEKTGNIVYDEGIESYIDDDQYTGENISLSMGHMLQGGSDGDFKEISVNGITRAPTEAEMKLLLSREYVKIFRGYKDRAILSPARINLDIIFDANYNMTSDEILMMDTETVPLYNASSVITDKDSQAITIMGKNSIISDFNDINVKKAIYDLNEFRNRNGMTVNPDRGAGCHVYFDAGLTGLKNIGINYELLNAINAFEKFVGRGCSVDLGYYNIYDSTTGRKIPVTVTYFLAKYLIPHLVKYGINKPFTFNYATITAIQRDSTLMTTGDMVRNSFAPNIDMIDWDVKERLFKSRINYYLSSKNGTRVQRAVQNTREMDASALLEESNVLTLDLLKKGLEEDNRGYLYEWSNPTVRKSYTDAQMKKYKPWIGKLVQDLRIYFQASEWEHERMMMHCYADVKFRNINKRIILEININKADYEEDIA